MHSVHLHKQEAESLFFVAFFWEGVASFALGLCAAGLLAEEKGSVSSVGAVVFLAVYVLAWLGLGVVGWRRER